MSRVKRKGFPFDLGCRVWGIRVPGIVKAFPSCDFSPKCSSRSVFSKVSVISLAVASVNPLLPSGNIELTFKVVHLVKWENFELIVVKSGKTGMKNFNVDTLLAKSSEGFTLVKL